MKGLIVIKTVKRLLAFIGAAMMILSVCLMTSCNNTQKVQDNVPFDFPYPDHIELSWWYKYDDTYFGTAYTELNEHPFMKRMEAATNVSIEFRGPTTATHIGEAQAELEAAMAAGDYTDMVTHNYHGITLEGNTLDAAIDEEIYLALNEYVDVQMPNFKALVEQYSIINKFLRTPQDNILYIPMLSGLLNYQNQTNTNGLVCRKDILDDLQLDVPVTVDDWYNVLSAVKKAGGAGSKIPLVAGSMLFAPSMDHDVFITCYDQRYEIYLIKDTNTVAYGAIEDGVKAYTEMMRTWIEEGIAVATDASQDQRVSDDIFAWVGSAENIMYYPSLAQNSEYELVACPDPVLNVGDKITYRANNARIGDKNANSIYLTYNCSQPAIAAKWIDQFFSEQAFNEASYGIEGEDYTKDADGNIVFTDKIKNNADGLALDQAKGETGFNANAIRFGIEQNAFLNSLWCDPEVIEKFAFSPKALAACDVWSSATGENCFISGSWLSFTEDESDLLAELNQFWNLQKSNIEGIIKGNKAISEWEDFVSSMKENGIEEYISIYQDAYDRYLAG